MGEDRLTNNAVKSTQNEGCEEDQGNTEKIVLIPEQALN
jgi:hypothetical protein